MLSNYMGFVVTVGVLPLTFLTTQAGTELIPGLSCSYFSEQLSFLHGETLPSLYLLLCETKIDVK